MKRPADHLRRPIAGDYFSNGGIEYLLLAQDRSQDSKHRPARFYIYLCKRAVGEGWLRREGYFEYPQLVFGHEDWRWLMGDDEGDDL